jgi:hypothetical protein
MSCLSNYTTLPNTITDTNYYSDNADDASAIYFTNTHNPGIIAYLMKNHNSSILEANDIDKSLFESTQFPNLNSLMIKYMTDLKYDQEINGGLNAMNDNLKKEQEFYLLRYAYVINEIKQMLVGSNSAIKMTGLDDSNTAFCDANSSGLNYQRYSSAEKIIVEKSLSTKCTKSISTELQNKLNIYIKNAHTLNNRLFTLGLATKILADIVLSKAQYYQDNITIVKNNIEGRAKNINDNTNNITKIDPVSKMNKDMVKFSEEKNRYSANLLKLYSFLNVVALGLLVYVYKSAE